LPVTVGHVSRRARELGTVGAVSLADEEKPVLEIDCVRLDLVLLR
jgi:hypothetical protein